MDGTLSVLQLAVADRLDDLVLSESELGASSLVAQGGALAAPLGFEAVDDSPLPRNGLGNGAAGDDMVSDAHAVRVLNRGYRRACGRAWAVCEQQGRSGDVPDSELARRYRRIPFQITPSPYTTRQGWTPASPAVGLERRRQRLDREAHARSRAIPAADLLAFLTAKHPLRDKTLWWLLYESAARAGEVLALDVDDLDLPRRRAVVIGKGGRAELVGWETRTARLLPRHLTGREQGPLFLTDLAPAPARQPAAADLDPASGHARLSYRRAAQLFRDATGGWTLHQLRHSRLTHLAEAGVQLPILMAKSRHTSLISLAVYAQPTFDAVAAATAALDPDRRH